MRYYLNFQQLPKGASRPEDNGRTVILDIQKDGHALLPNVGDFVSMDNSTTKDKISEVHGRVKSRVFFYLGSSDTVEGACSINIVVEETADDWGLLIKE